MTKGLEVSRANLLFMAKVLKNSRNERERLHFRKYKKVYLKLLKSSKKKFYCTKIEEARNSSKEIWNVIKEVENKNSCEKADFNCILINNNQVTDSKQISELTCKHLIKIGLNDDADENKAIKFCQKLFNHKSMFLFPVHEDEVRKVIQKINKK